MVFLCLNLLKNNHMKLSFSFALLVSGFLWQTPISFAQTVTDSTQTAVEVVSESFTLPDLGSLDKEVSLFYVRGFLAEDRIPEQKRREWEAKLNSKEAVLAKQVVQTLRKEQQVFLRGKLVQERAADLPQGDKPEGRPDLPKAPKGKVSIPKTAPPQVKIAAKVVKGAAQAAGGAMCNNLPHAAYWEWLGICD